MAYNEQLADRIRTALTGTKNMTEKKMFGGIAFMINDRMCIGVDKDDIMLRCEPGMTDTLLAEKGARPFDLTGKPMKGWLLVGPEGTKTGTDFDQWMQIALEGNRNAKATKKK